MSNISTWNAMYVELSSLFGLTYISRNELLMQTWVDSIIRCTCQSADQNNLEGAEAETDGKTKKSQWTIMQKAQ